MNIASRLCDLRMHSGLSRYSLSKKTGLSETQLGNYERGKTLPNLSSLGKILDALGCTYSEFFNESDSDAIYPSAKELAHIKCYRALTLSQQDSIDGIMNEMLMFMIH